MKNTNKQAETRDSVAEQRAHTAEKTGAFKLGQGPVSEILASQAAEATALAASHVADMAGALSDAAASMIDKMSSENIRGLIVQECRALEQLLLEKNAGYGNSALDPIRLFSRATPIEQLKVRIDDKLSRISRGDFSKVKEEDLKVVTKDLLGYLILIRVGWRLGLE